MAVKKKRSTPPTPAKKPPGAKPRSRPASRTKVAKKPVAATPPGAAASPAPPKRRFLTEAAFRRARREFAVQSAVRLGERLPTARDATRVRRARRATVEAPPLGLAPDTGFDPCKPGTTTRLCTPVRNQNDSDLCIAFAVAGAMEAALCRKHQDTVGVPEINADHVFRKEGAQVGSVSTIQKAVAGGVLDVQCLPFGHSAPCGNQANHTFKCDLRAVRALPSQRVKVMKEQLRAVGPLVTLIKVFDNFLGYNKTAPYTPEGTPAAGFHAVCIVGYEVDPGGATGRWIAKNSMGPGWGDKGFFRISWGQGDVRAEEVVFVAANVEEP